MATAAEVNALYNKYLGRDALQGGLDYWLGTGQTIQEIEYNISISREAQVVSAFKEGAGRLPDNDERQFLVNQQPEADIGEFVDLVAEEEGYDPLAETVDDDTTADTDVETGGDIATEERLYDYTNQREDGGSQNLYWGNYSRQVTASELEELYNLPDNTRIREAFGTFDNYMAYMDERQDLIDSGDYKADWWDTGVALVDVEGLGREGGQDDRALEMDIMQEGARQGEAGYNEQKDVFESLYEKYTGESVVKYLDNGARYEWNGTSFVLTQEAYGMHLGSVVGTVLPAIVITAGLGPAGANVFGSGFGAGASRGAISSMLGQYVTSGKVDPKSVAQSAALGGIGGFFDDVVNATPGVYGGWVVDGAVVGTPGQFAIEKIQYLSRTLGIPFNEAAGIVEGILTGAINGQDLEGIAINAVAGWGDAKASNYIKEILGADGVDVDNFFREGSTNISTEAIQGLVSNGIQALVDGGMSDVDIFKTMYQFVDQGGSLDFLWPALGKLDIDFDVEFGGLSNFCTTFPDFPLCTDGGKLPDICEKDTEGEKPWYCNVDIDVDLPDVDVGLTGVDVDLTIKCPEGFKDEDGNCIPIDIKCPEGFKNEEGQCIPITIKCPEGFKDEDGTCVPINIDCPAGFKYSESQKQCIKIVCPEGFKNEEGECVPINCPSGFRYDDSRGECIQIPILNCEDLNFPIPNSVKGQTHSKQINEDGTEECVPDIVECIEGFDFDGQTCVEIKGPDIGCEDKKIPNGVQKFKKNSLGECIPDVVECIEGFDFDGQQCVKIDIPKPCFPPGSGKVRNELTDECECPPGQEENALGFCIDPVDNCPVGQQRNAEGVCEDIEGPEGPDGPDIELPPFEMPDINIPQFEQPQTMQPTQVTADPRLLTRSQFPITDYLSQAIKGGGMLTGNGNKIV